LKLLSGGTSSGWVGSNFLTEIIAVQKTGRIFLLYWKLLKV